MKLRTAKPKKARQTKAIRSENCRYSPFVGSITTCQHNHRVIAMNEDRKRIIIEALTKEGMYHNEEQG
jgi:hypothetical protein